jgi:hypothetical protein
MFRLIFQAIRTIIKIHQNKTVAMTLLLNEQVLGYQTPFHYAGLQAKFGLQWAKINSMHRMNNG